MSKVYNLIFAGVGGQGSLLMAQLTSIAASQAGYDVKQTEVHGVSQRGGSVETQVRFGETVYSPVVTPGEADVVVGLEKLEALRFAHFAEREKGVILINDYEIVPASVSGAENLYPHEAVEYLRARGLTAIAMPASKIAGDLGDGRMANVVMLGALTSLLPIADEVWKRALHVRLPPRYLEANLLAYSAGRQAIQLAGVDRTV